MTRLQFRQLCLSRPLILDGATGTELLKRGMPVGVCPEKWAVENPEKLRDIEARYRHAGSDIVYACTFGCNRAKLEEFSLQNEIIELNQRAVTICRDAIGDGLVFGDLAPTGKLLEPYGDCSFANAMNIFREQAQILINAGADGIIIETMLDIQEARAALIAVREIAPDLPIMVSVTFGDNGQTLTGTDPITALITLQALGADAVGCNCSAGPEKMLAWIRAMKPYSTVPLIAKPNAGQPQLINGKTVFNMAANEYANYFPQLINAGANIVGGCCGSTPDHISAVKKILANINILPPPRASVNAVTSSRKTIFIGNDSPFAVIGERINPTGKKALQAELREGKLTLVREMALAQEQAGAALLDVNMGMSGIDENIMLTNAVKQLSTLTTCPLCIDTANPTAMEAALKIYPGRALLNSITAEKTRLKKMLPLAKKYGAMIIVLPVTDKGVAEKLAARQKVTKQIIRAAKKIGLQNDDFLIDGLVMTVSTSPDAPQITADFVEWCARKLKMPTTVGLSNVSFGMPQREHLNAGFLGLLIGRGLTVALINPANSAMMNLTFSTDALLERDINFKTYLQKFADGLATPNLSLEARATNSVIYNAVLHGDNENIAAYLQSALTNNRNAQEIVDTDLLPAINRVGELYEKKTYFLPQLMLSAAALSAGFKFLEPHLAKTKNDNADGVNANAKKIIMATVKGDIHDIGKNIVCLLLRNYGFTVIDLGKDVDAKTIIETAKRENVKLVGLSALMTTTMIEMNNIITCAQKNGGRDLRFIIGGAVVDQKYATEIGAHGYATDAVAAVKLAQTLV